MILDAFQDDVLPVQTTLESLPVFVYPILQVHFTALFA